MAEPLRNAGSFGQWDQNVILALLLLGSLDADRLQQQLELMWVILDVEEGGLGNRFDISLCHFL